MSTSVISFSVENKVNQSKYERTTNSEVRAKYKS